MHLQKNMVALQNLAPSESLPFLTDLVFYGHVADANLKSLVKIEKESLLKQLFTNIQHSSFMIATNFKKLHILNKGEVCALNSAKSIILRAFV